MKTCPCDRDDPFARLCEACLARVPALTDAEVAAILEATEVCLRTPSVPAVPHVEGFFRTL